MRSQVLFQPSRSLVYKRATLKAPRVLFSHSVGGYYPRREANPVRAASSTHKRASSSSTASVSISAVTDSSTTTSSAEPEGPEEPEKPENDPDKLEESEKIKRIRKPKVLEPSLPPGLDVLWTPGSSEPDSPSSLPPPEIFHAALTNLLITLHPHIQHRGVYASESGPAVEPTLALYCPIEGGDYIIDEAVWELARRTDSDVVVLDTVQLAAGEWGNFGKAATAINLQENPLHFRPATKPPAVSSWSASDEDFADNGDYGFSVYPKLTLTVLTPEISTRSGRPTVLKTVSRSSAASKTKAFFDELINLPSARDAEAVQQGRRRSRIIYVRDFPTLAASSSSWYPQLVAAVRQRRQGPIPRPSSPVNSSVTIVFGITPPIVQPSSPPQGGSQNLLSLVNTQQTTIMNSSSKPSKNDYGEDEHAEKARERRLRERLRKWERDEHALYDEIPRLSSLGDSSKPASDGSSPISFNNPIMGDSPLPSVIANALQRISSQGGNSSDKPPFFRMSTLVPMIRDTKRESDCRVSRRREINMLTMRMSVGAIGGRLEGDPTIHSVTNGHDHPAGVTDEKTEEMQSKLKMMLDEWGQQVEIWSSVKEIADRAIGNVVATNPIEVISTPTFPGEPTPVPWSAIVSAWHERRSSRDVRKTWLHESGVKTTKDIFDEGRSKEATGPEQDEVIRRVKEDSDLSSHENRLLRCIVDAGSMPTSFSDVHLPSHTIDSVRTLVSLPLLHPSAFQQGILKQHSMTGCLLFGPPGTGKTLIVRALAKEAGCRMLAVQPSDVMDMYVGEGEKLVRSVFSLARRLSPCVIFLDEIDALFGARSSSREAGGALAHNGIVTEFMQEMDGLKTNRETNVIVIGATNRPFDLDDAVLRRLPRRLLVDLPGVKEREEILKILLRDETLGLDVDLQSLAKRTELFSGSDLKHICVSAALDAVKENVKVPWATSNVRTSKSCLSVNMELPQNNGAIVSDRTAVEEKIQDASRPDGSDPLPSVEPVIHRTLFSRHFNKALIEITPSSSESLGSLSALRKWNEEFGEGLKNRRRIMWGKGSFGFSEKGDSSTPSEGHVSGP